MISRNRGRLNVLVILGVMAIVFLQGMLLFEIESRLAGMTARVPSDVIFKPGTNLWCEFFDIDDAYSNQIELRSRAEQIENQLSANQGALRK